tara:strand:- start:273 stop:1238 length:966 start_codon:yes stop_codon:yes gene_type:complete
MEIGQNFTNNGFFISQPIIGENEIDSTRKDLDNEFENFDRSKGSTLKISEVKDPKIIKKIIDILYSKETKKIISDLESHYNKPVSLLPPLEIMKNYHVNLKTHLGWHRDCGGELEHDYCKEKLFKKDYLFTKVGIYLQNNTEYGGSIDIIKTSHKNFSKSQLILRKIKSIPLRFTQSFHKYFSKLYYFLPEKLFMFLVNAKRLYPMKGSAVFFDSRLVHRGSPISKNKLNEALFSKKFVYSAEIPKQFDKYAIYSHFGTVEAVDSYMYDRLKRKGNDNEFKNWLDEVKVIEKYNPELAKKMLIVLDPLKSKYSDIIKKTSK